MLHHSDPTLYQGVCFHPNKVYRLTVRTSEYWGQICPYLYPHQPSAVRHIPLGDFDSQSTLLR